MKGGEKGGEKENGDSKRNFLIRLLSSSYYVCAIFGVNGRKGKKSKKEKKSEKREEEERSGETHSLLSMTGRRDV